MISIRKSLERIEDFERRFEAVLGRYIIKAIANMQTYAIPVDRTLEQHYRELLKRLRRFVKEEPLVERLRQCSEELKKYLSASRAKEQEPLDALWQEIRYIRNRLERAEALATTDRLTGIRNRVAGEKKLEEYVASDKPFFLVLLDLDGFKMVNDHWGHQAGDQVLRTFAQRLANNVRKEDTVCRWGGDEFLVILDGCNLQEAMLHAKELAEKCGGVFRIVVEGRPACVEVHVSVGTVERKPGETSEDLFRRADKFLYRDKRSASESALCAV